MASTQGSSQGRGPDMTNDIDELTALNLDFVAAAQNSDVRRFDEILAPEFYCTNPDKSLVDRVAFLEQSAKPVAIKNLQAHDVKIRIMGHLAIFHAATSYTTPGTRVRLWEDGRGHLTTITSCPRRE